jgi:hypothetical protein
MWKTLKRGRVILLKGPVWAHKTSLTPPLLIVPNQECKRKCTYAVNIEFVSFYDLFFLNFRTVWYLFFILFPRFFCWWNSGLGCAQNYGELKPVDGILVWDVHTIMASSNRLMKFWFGMCTKQWLAQTDWRILVWDMHKIMATSNRWMEFQPYSVNNGISKGNTDIPKR